MRGGPLQAERETAIAATNSVGIACAWAWETDARAGEYCSEAVCIGHAKTSDVLILILGSDLTPITEKEYEAAGSSYAQRIILVKDGIQRRRAAREFLAKERANKSTTKNFQNLSELRSHIIEALQFHAVQSARLVQANRMVSTGPSADPRGTAASRGRKT